jgi:hypothetical protein
MATFGEHVAAPGGGHGRHARGRVLTDFHELLRAQRQEQPHQLGLSVGIRLGEDAL